MVDNISIGQALTALQNTSSSEPTETEELSLTLAEPTSVSRQSTLNEVIDSDVDIANNVLKALHVGWGTVRSVSSLCKMADTTLNAIEKRRKILNLQYGAESQISKGTVVYPMD